MLDLSIVSLRKNSELVELMARKMSKDQQQYEAVKAVLVKWSE